MAGWQTEIVDSGTFTGTTSLAFDEAGNPAISYYDDTNLDLKFARFVPEDCTNGIDDDSDGLVDCNDPECPPCPTTTTTTTSTTTTTVVCQCPTPTGCVSGRVTNLAGEPIPGKVVKFRGRLFAGGPKFRIKTRTDDNGCYQFSLSEGIGKISVKRCRGEGIKTVSVPLGGKVNDVNFECR